MSDEIQAVGQVIEGYTILEPLGAGGFGRINAAFSPERRQVVLEFVPKSSAIRKMR